MLVTSGLGYKYVPSPTRNFYRAAQRLLSEKRDAHLLMVGVDRHDAAPYVGESGHERLHLLGRVEDPLPYYAAADLYLEGFPLGSLTALLEAAAVATCPVLAPAPEMPLLGFDDVSLDGVVEHPPDEDAFVERVAFLIENAAERRALATEVRDRVWASHAGDEWLTHLERCYSFLDAATHRPRPLSPIDARTSRDDVALCAFGLLRGTPEAVLADIERLRETADDLAELTSGGERFVLVDQEELRSALGLAAAIPFLERDGKYWGPPPDDPTAVRELERLRQRGATAIVFAWPAFWWLDHYEGLHRYLRSQYSQTLENERLVVFDLRGKA